MAHYPNKALHYQGDDEEGRITRPMHYDAIDMMHKLGLGIYYHDSYFIEDVADKK